MHDNEPGPLTGAAETVGEETPPPADAPAPGNDGDDVPGPTLRDDLTALVEDARIYAEAEIAFQKTRAEIAGKAAGRALAALVLALVLLHIALIALAVGVVFALAPLVTIWGAILIVVGAMLAGVGLLAWAALRDGKLLAALFSPEDAA